MGKLLHNGLRCDIFNTNQGSQFTSLRFTTPLLDLGIAVSYECVYLRQFDTVSQARVGLKEYFEFYNHERLH